MMDLQNLSRPYTLLWLAQGDSPMIRAGVSVCGRLFFCREVSDVGAQLHQDHARDVDEGVHGRVAVAGHRRSGVVSRSGPRGRRGKRSGDHDRTLARPSVQHLRKPVGQRVAVPTLAGERAVNGPAGFHLCRVGRAAWKDTRDGVAPPVATITSHSPVRAKALARRGSRYQARPRPTLLVRP